MAIWTARPCAGGSSPPAGAPASVRIRFHDLRHTFGTLAVRGAESIVELQHWLGHAEVRTTMRYTHYREQQDAAKRLATAFRLEAAPPSSGAVREAESGPGE